MTVVYAPPDVEAAVITVLEAATGVAVSTRVPRDRPGSFIKVTSIAAAGADTLVTTNPLVLIECWAGNESDAFALARKASGALWQYRSGGWLSTVWVTALECSYPVNYPDPESQQARYQFNVDMSLAMSPITI